MKKLLYIFFVLSLSANAQQIWTDHSRLLPDALRGIPTGIELWHNPTPVYPELNDDTVNYPGKFIWKHETTAFTRKGELKVITAGSFIWMGDRGWIANINLDNAGFADRFRCPGGLLKPGKRYTFAKNWRFGNKIYAGDALWFVLAKDHSGKIYKGVALVETEGTLKTR